MKRSDLIAAAREYMIDNYGRCNESDDRDRWNERFGLLVDFLTTISERTPPAVTAAASPKANTGVKHE